MSPRLWIPVPVPVREREAARRWRSSSRQKRSAALINSGQARDVGLCRGEDVSSSRDGMWWRGARGGGKRGAPGTARVHAAAAAPRVVREEPAGCSLASDLRRVRLLTSRDTRRRERRGVFSGRGERGKAAELSTKASVLAFFLFLFSSPRGGYGAITLRYSPDCCDRGFEWKVRTNDNQGACHCPTAFLCSRGRPGSGSGTPCQQRPLA